MLNTTLNELANSGTDLATSGADKPTDPPRHITGRGFSDVQESSVWAKGGKDQLAREPYVPCERRMCGLRAVVWSPLACPIHFKFVILTIVFHQMILAILWEAEIYEETTFSLLSKLQFPRILWWKPHNCFQTAFSLSLKRISFKPGPSLHLLLSSGCNSLTIWFGPIKCLWPYRRTELYTWRGPMVIREAIAWLLATSMVYYASRTSQY